MFYNVDMQDEFFMQEALKEAQKAYELGEIPVGAVVVKDNKIIGRGHNLREKNNDISSHAEIEALKDAAKTLGNWRMNGCVLYVTLEPCPMCSGAILQSRLRRVVFGSKDPRDGAVVSNYYLFDSPCVHERPLFSVGTLSDECEKLLKLFFLEKRN